MDDDPLIAEADTDEVDTSSPDRPSEPTDPHALALIHRIDGVGEIAGDGPHLDDDAGGAVSGQDVDLAAIDLEIARHHIETVLTQETSGYRLPDPANRDPVGQIDISCCSNSSTLTSRKVSTFTC